MSVLAQLKAELTDQPRNPLRPHQVQEHRDELARVQAVAGGLDVDGQQRPWMPGDRGAAYRRAQQIKKVLHEQAPKPASGEQKDRIAALTKEVIDTVIAPSMLTEAEMRRNPAGAVGQFTRREGSKPIKDAILTARQGLLAVEPENDDPDYLNMDRFRSSGLVPNAPTFMADAQMPGYVSYSHIPQEQWPFSMPQNTAIAQVKLREAEITEPVKPKRTVPASSLAGLAKGRAARAAKLAAAKAALESADSA